ncbi:MAG: translation initiation factor IF-3 [Chthoniobacteraceae bacterium]
MAEPRASDFLQKPVHANVIATTRTNQGPACRSIRPSRTEPQPINLNQIRVNGRIRAREVRVIVASTGEQLGVLKLSDAIRHAQGLGLDLVEVAPTANPPVCRIVDYGKFKYEAAKHDKDKKNSGSKLKEIKFRVNCAEHDYETKMRHAEEFLDKGNKVRVQLQYRGREMAHQELGLQLMTRVKNDLVTMAAVEQEPKTMGKNVTMTLAPLPQAKRKRKFLSDHDLPPMEDDHDDEDEGEDSEA